MIDQECGNLRRTVIVCLTLADFFRIDFDAFCSKRIGSGLTNVDIKGKCLNKVLRHAASSWRAPYWKRLGSAQKPSRKPEVRNSDNMIRVKKREKESVYLFRIDFSLRQANYDSAA